MPLVYPPNFEGVSLSYEFDHAFILRSGYPLGDEFPCEVTTGDDSSPQIEPEYCFFYFENVGNLRLKVVGFVNANDSGTVIIYDNPGRTYYYGFCGIQREGDTVFVLLKCRITLNGTFSEPIYTRVFLEERPGDNHGYVISWEYLPLCAYLDFGQTIQN